MVLPTSRFLSHQIILLTITSLTILKYSLVQNPSISNFHFPRSQNVTFLPRFLKSNLVSLTNSIFHNALCWNSYLPNFVQVVSQFGRPSLPILIDPSGSKPAFPYLLLVRVHVRRGLAGALLCVSVLFASEHAFLERCWLQRQRVKKSLIGLALALNAPAGVCPQVTSGSVQPVTRPHPTTKPGGAVLLGAWKERAGGFGAGVAQAWSTLLPP